MPIKYKQLLTSAMQMILHHKYLWFFGLFSAFLTGGFSYRIDDGSFLYNWQQLQSTGIFDLSIFSKITELAQVNPTGLIVQASILIAVIILGLFLLWLAIVSQGALINSVSKIDSNKKTDFSDGLQAGKKHFWAIFFFRVLERVVIVALLLVVLVSAFAALAVSQQIFIRLIYYIATVVVIILIFLLTIAVRYAISYQVIKDLRFIESLQVGFWLLKRNFLASIEAGIIIFAVSFVLGFLVLMLLAAAVIPFAFLLFIFFKLAFNAVLMAVLITGIITLFILIVIIGGILGAFNDIYWTLVFLQVAKNNPKSIIRSVFN
ncbi:MAG: hypothetical protein ABIH48_00245 [Candidatus Falkowbacteria bacterium]